METEPRPYPTLPLRPRAAKPRQTGLTITVEFGTPVASQRDQLEVAGDAIDLAKIAVGIAGLMPPSVLRGKIATYRAHGVEAFPGGMYLEYACRHGKEYDYLHASAAAGFRYVEVSENAGSLGPGVRERLVSQALDQGLTVLGEVGRKGERTTAATLVEDARHLLDAGCWKVLVEGAELLAAGGVRADLLSALEAELPVDQLVFELPGPWLPGVSQHHVYSMESFLVSHFGSDVNIANEPPGNVLFLEALRRGVGPTLDVRAEV